MKWKDSIKLVFYFCLWCFSAKAQIKSTFRTIEGYRYTCYPDSFAIRSLKGLPPISAPHYSYTGLLHQALNSFSKSHLGNKELPIAYSLFSLGRYYLFISDKPKTYTEQGEQACLQFLKKNFFAKHDFNKTLYEWVLPYYQDLFSQMGCADQALYYHEFKKVKAYLANFNLKSESNFAKSNPREFSNTNGKWASFLFRRMYNKEFTREECMQWLQKIEKDFLPLLKDTTVFSNYSNGNVKSTSAATIYYFQCPRGYGLLDSNGHAIKQEFYEQVFDFENGNLALLKDGLWGVLSSEGKDILLPVYETVLSISRRFFAGRKQGKWAIFNSDAKQLTAFDWDKVEQSGNFLIVQNGNKVGVLDTLGFPVMPCEYAAARATDYPLFPLMVGKMSRLAIDSNVYNGNPPPFLPDNPYGERLDSLSFIRFALVDDKGNIRSDFIYGPIMDSIGQFVAEEMRDVYVYRNLFSSGDYGLFLPVAINEKDELTHVSFYWFTKEGKCLKPVGGSKKWREINFLKEDEFGNTLLVSSAVMAEIGTENDFPTGFIYNVMGERVFDFPITLLEDQEKELKIKANNKEGVLTRELKISWNK